MSMRRGVRRSAVFLTILYWAVVVKMAVLRASYGVWDAGGPMGFLGAAAIVYAMFFGFFWTLNGFFSEPRRRW
jgi:hypothetical protein